MIEEILPKHCHPYRDVFEKQTFDESPDRLRMYGIVYQRRLCKEAQFKYNKVAEVDSRV